MEKIVSESKTIEDALEKLYLENDLTSNEIIYKKEIKKGKLLKSDTIVVTAYLKTDLCNVATDFLKQIAEGLNACVKCEILNSDQRTIIKLYSENNSVLIGKNGQTIKALETLIRQKIFVDFGVNFKINLDVEDYREKKDQRIVHLARKSAKEVLETKIPVTLDSMTSYERRLVHSTLSEFDGITTRSEGEEPNRYTIIEPK